MAEPTANPSTLSWPYSSLGHLTTNTGSNDYSHESTATWVYLPRQIPNPWPYLLASWTISFVFAVFGLASSSSPREDKKPSWISKFRLHGIILNMFRRIVAVVKVRLGLVSSSSPKKDDKTPWTSKFRIPGIIFNMFRCIVAVVKVARINKTKLVPSHVSNTGCAMSLITNIFTWDEKLDSWSVVAVIGTTAFWCLNISQIILSHTAEYGFGKMMIEGGNCPRKLIGSEKCKTLEFIGCSESPQVPVLEDISINVTEIVGVLIISSAVVFGILGKLSATIRRRPYGSKQIRWYAIVTLVVLLWMSTGTYMDLRSTSYVDSIGARQLDSNTTHMSEVLWSDCFSAFEPRRTDGFFVPWATDVWNESKTSALLLFAAL